MRLGDAKAPHTPNEQAAALAGTAEKKIGPYKTFHGTPYPVENRFPLADEISRMGTHDGLTPKDGA